MAKLTKAQRETIEEIELVSALVHKYDGEEVWINHLKDFLGWSYPKTCRVIGRAGLDWLVVAVPSSFAQRPQAEVINRQTQLVTQVSKVKARDCAAAFIDGLENFENFAGLPIRDAVISGYGWA